MTQFGDLEITVEHVYDDDFRWRKYVEACAGIEPVYAVDRYSSYRLRQDSAALRHRRLEGATVPVAAITASVNQDLTRLMTDRDPASRWETGRGQEAGDSMTIDIGSPKRLRGIELALGAYSADYPRRLSIETSTDGQSWAEAWTGSGGGPALTAAIFNPRLLPLTFPLDGHTARYLRLTQLGSDPIFFWSIAELTIYGQ
jgi:hypothetical protein